MKLGGSIKSPPPEAVSATTASQSVGGQVCSRGDQPVPSPGLLVRLPGADGVIHAGARVAVPRLDAGPDAAGVHRVGVPLPLAGVRGPPLMDPRPSKFRTASPPFGLP